MSKRAMAQSGVCLALLLLLWWLPLTPPPTVAAGAWSPGKRAVSYGELPAEAQAWLRSRGVAGEDFARLVARIERETAAREIEGEYDHLIFFLLQSTRFTRQPRIEPALSAEEFVRGLSAAERAGYLAAGSGYLPPEERLPRRARARMIDFIKALDKALDRPSTDERMAYFRAFFDGGAPLIERLYAEYARAMRFLYLKEFAARDGRSAEESAAYVSSLYRDRGHSTDTQIEANYALHVALSVLRAQAPAKRLEKVLIVGPGLDFAPRTDLIDLFGPQSYQPFALADALIGLGLADLSRLSIHCVDINARVISHLQRVAGEEEIHLRLLSGVAESAARPFAAGYRDYFRGLGRSIGSERALEVPEMYASRLRKTLSVRKEILERTSAGRLNIITERYEPSPGYDLVVVTNVFPYFKAEELLLSLANIAAMTAEGGYLIHNELQAVPASFTTAVGLPLEQARTILIAGTKEAPLFDGVAIHRRVAR